MSFVSLLGLANGQSSQSTTAEISPAQHSLFAETSASDSLSVSVGIDTASEAHSQFCAGVSKGIVRIPFPSLSLSTGYSADITQSLRDLSLTQRKPISAAERQKEINLCAQQIADIVHESQTAIAEAATSTKLVDEHKSEALPESKRGGRSAQVRSKAVQEARLLAKFVEKVVTRVTLDTSRTRSFEKTFTQLLDNDAEMLKCCQKIAALNLLPKERFVVIDHVAKVLGDTFRKNPLVPAVQESGKYEEENVELCLQYTSTLTIINLIKSSPDLKSLTKEVKQIAPTWLKAKASDLD